MSDRLADLQRQRALAQEQVAWFDREIAKEANQKTPAAPTIPGKPAAPAAPDHTAAEILAQYQQSPLTTEKDVKRGCYLYFAFALGAVAIAAVGAYLIYTRHR